MQIEEHVFLASKLSEKQDIWTRDPSSQSKYSNQMMGQKTWDIDEMNNYSVIFFFNIKRLKLKWPEFY